MVVELLKYTFKFVPQIRYGYKYVLGRKFNGKNGVF